MSFVIFPWTIIRRDVYTPTETFMHRKCGHFDDDFNVVKVNSLYVWVCVCECVFTGCSREGAKITANDRISVGHGTGWAKGKGFVYNPVPLSSLYRQERTPDTPPLPNLQWTKVDAAQGSLQSRLKDAGTKVRHVRSSDTTSCRKSLLWEEFIRDSIHSPVSLQIDVSLKI